MANFAKLLNQLLVESNSPKEQVIIGLRTAVLDQLEPVINPLVAEFSALGGSLDERAVAKQLGVPTLDQWIQGAGAGEIRQLVTKASIAGQVTSSYLTREAKARYYEHYPAMRPLVGRPPDPERFVLARLLELCVKHGLAGAKQELGIDEETGRGQEEKPAAKRAVAA